MSAKVLTKAAAKEAKIDIIEDGRGTQAVHDVVVAMRAARRSGSANTKTKAEVDMSGRQTVAAKRHRSRARRLQFIAHLAWRWRGVRTEAARLFQESFEIGPASRVSESVERANQGRRRPDDRQICGLRIENENVCRSCPQTDRREEGADRFRFVRRDHLQVGAEREAGKLATAANVNTEQLLAFQKILVTRAGLEKLAERTNGK